MRCRLLDLLISPYQGRLRRTFLPTLRRARSISVHQVRESCASMLVRRCSKADDHVGRK